MELLIISNDQFAVEGNQFELNLFSNFRERASNGLLFEDKIRDDFFEKDQIRSTLPILKFAIHLS